MRQYIGARYVPRFTGDYDATQIYEALDVVDNGMGTSYIAKKPVPAGTALTNTEYWAIYGASSGAILDLQGRMDAAENNITDLQNQNKYLVVFGDSWSSPDIGWPGKVASRLGLTLKNYAENGAGFDAGSISIGMEIDSFLAEDIPSDEIYAIIIYGGVNDLGDNYPSDTYMGKVATAINKLSAYTCKKYFFSCNAFTTNYAKAYRYYQGLSRYLPENNVDITIINAVHWISYWYTGKNLYKADNQHPTNDAGYEWLAYVIKAVLLTGKAPDNTVYCDVGNDLKLVSTYKGNTLYIRLDRTTFTGTYTPTGTAPTFNILSSSVPYVAQLPIDIGTMVLFKRANMKQYRISISIGTGRLLLYMEDVTAFDWGDLTEEVPIMLECTI